MDEFLECTLSHAGFEQNEDDYFIDFGDGIYCVYRGRLLLYAGRHYRSDNWSEDRFCFEDPFTGARTCVGKEEWDRISHELEQPNEMEILAWASRV